MITDPGPHVSGWRRVVRAHPVVTFYLLAFGISWAGFVPIFAASRGAAFFSSPLWKGVLISMAVGPALAAWIVSVWTGERGTASSRLRTAYGVPVAWQWWVVAAFLPTTLMVVANLLSRVFLGNCPSSIPPSSALGVLGLVLFAVAANPWEEIGWRGFALRRLQQKYSVGIAALIVGVLWALWHIPLFVWAESPMSQLPYWPWAAGVIARSLVMASLFNRTRQSLAIVTVFHISMNVSGAILGLKSEAMLASVDAAMAAFLFLKAPTCFLWKVPADDD